jgi:signal transduction histidine kinase
VNGIARGVGAPQLTDPPCISDGVRAECAGEPGSDAQRALLNMLEDFSEERARTDDVQRAILNILEDAGEERERTGATARAILNILEDSGEERERTEGTARAILNILEDSGEERERTEATARAILNILEDSGEERSRTTDTQRAILNILDDLTSERDRLEEMQKAVMNIVEDFDLEKANATAANTELRVEIAERQRAERDLEQKQQELARSNEELQMFAYAASHDLSEPLRAIAGPATMLARRYRGALDADADEWIRFITDGCERMQRLITDLLAYSRVGRLEVARQAVDCNRLVQHVTTVLAARIDEAQADVRVGCLPTVIAEPTQLGEVFQNLLSNALKFAADDRAPRVEVTAEPVEFGWRFTVTDNGIGIEPRHRDRVFGMFKRLHGRDEYPGTGIGLALVKKIVERHDGSIWIEAPPSGVGTRFAFTIPAAVPSASLGAAPPDALGTATTGSGRLKAGSLTHRYQNIDADHPRRSRPARSRATQDPIGCGRTEAAGTTFPERAMPRDLMEGGIS